jgi:hypothetical protein
MFHKIITGTEESKRQDIALRHYAGRSVGSEPEVVQVPRGRVLASSRGAAQSRTGPGADTFQDG